MLRQPEFDFVDPVSALARVLSCEGRGVIVLGLEWKYPIPEHGIDVDFGPDYSSRIDSSDPLNVLIACRDIGGAIARYGIDALLVEVVTEEDVAGALTDTV